MCYKNSVCICMYTVFLRLFSGYNSKNLQNSQNWSNYVSVYVLYNLKWIRWLSKKIDRIQGAAPYDIAALPPVLIEFLSYIRKTSRGTLYSVMQSDGNSLKIDTFRYNLWTINHILIMKTPIRSYWCLAKTIFWWELV